MSPKTSRHSLVFMITPGLCFTYNFFFAFCYINTDCLSKTHPEPIGYSINSLQIQTTADLVPLSIRFLSYTQSLLACFLIVSIIEHLVCIRLDILFKVTLDVYIYSKFLYIYKLNKEDC